MGNRIFKSLLDEKIEFFRFAFDQTSKNIFFNEEKKLIHPGEYGGYRENICKDFIKMIIPGNLEIGSGFLLTDNGAISTQCDIVIYEKSFTPLIESSERQRFFPVETTVAVGEIKSDLSKEEFIKALNKLARNKKLRENITHPSPLKRSHPGSFDPINYPYDHIFSFIICNKLNFNISSITNDIDSYYEHDIQPWQKHNLILSVQDGLFAYLDNNKMTLMYPYVKESLKNRFITPYEENINSHFYFMSSYLFMGATSNSIYYPELSDYIVLGNERKIDQTN